jgi:two-component system alkaline phosphatase synthesis response regulator PhoP
MKKPKILIIEDEADIRELLEYTLAREGFQTAAVGDGVTGLSEARRQSPDLLVLDLMLPGLDGLEVCRRLKQDEATANIAIMMLTAKGEETDVVLGLGIGADDYVTKPFSPKEVVARARALLRRTGSAADHRDDKKKVVHGQIVIDPTRHKVFVAEEEIPVTATEFRILHYLACRPGRVFSRDQIISGALGPNPMVLDRSVDVHVRAIRKKLADHRTVIETVRGVGYRFAEAAV